MTAEEHSRLQSYWVDRAVRVIGGRADLDRFRSLRGTVKAVTWNGCCLVEFDHGQDIGWYDIEPGDLAEVSDEMPQSATNRESA